MFHKVEDMILLVLLILTYVMGGMGGAGETNNTTSNSNKNSRSIVQSTTPNKIKETAKDILKTETKNFQKTVKQCLDVQPTSWETYNRLEREVINNVLNSTEQGNYKFEDVTLAVFQMVIKAMNNLSSTASEIKEQTFEADSIKILIPPEIFQKSQCIQCKVATVVYESNQQFNKRYAYFCHYYDEKGIGYGTWKTDGCLTTQLIKEVECTCDHLTAFAVLLVDLGNDSIDSTQWEILSYISYVGCCLSTIFTAFSILSFIFNKNARAEVSSKIHASLSGALFLLNMSFMLSEWVATLTMTGVCAFVAVTIHYSLLSSFSWMAIEAMHLYLLLGRVFNIHFKYYMFKLSIIGWGIPAVVVGSTLSLHNKHPIYGTSEVKFSNTNTTSAFCWITQPLVLYGVNLSYFTIVFVFNSVILITVSRQIFKLKQVDSKNKFKPLKDIITVLGLMCLLGSSWGLVFLGSGYTSYPILYLFCISNTMQGFSVFLWMCRTSRPEKKKAAQTKSLSTVNSTIENPQL